MVFDGVIQKIKCGPFLRHSVCCLSVKSGSNETVRTVIVIIMLCGWTGYIPAKDTNDSYIECHHASEGADSTTVGCTYSVVLWRCCRQCSGQFSTFTTSYRQRCSSGCTRTCHSKAQVSCRPATNRRLYCCSDSLLPVRICRRLL